MRKRIKQFRLLVSLPLAVLIIGTLGFMILERLSVLDALYFTIVTISTVGYGDIHPTNVASKIFGIFLIIIGIGTFLTIISNITRLLIQRGQNQLRTRRLNMIIGIFFTEVGNKLLHILSGFDPEIDGMRHDCTLDQNCTDADFTELKKKFRHYTFSIDPNLLDLELLSNFLRERGELLLRQIENPDLLEHERYTELLWAIVHLRDELMARNSLRNLPEPDLEHLANDAKRIYSTLIRQWLDYLQYIKRSYPYLFSLALRTNPFVKNPKVNIE